MRRVMSRLKTLVNSLDLIISCLFLIIGRLPVPGLVPVPLTAPVPGLVPDTGLVPVPGFDPDPVSADS